jgi:tRNA-dihydrouridine synthase
MIMNLWEKLPRPFFALAPMEEVTDIVFRHVVARAGRPDIFFTEFTNTSSFASPRGRDSTRGRLNFTPDEQPIIPQIWGSKPADFEITAYGLKEMGYRGIDINMGCPDKAVVKSGGGSALIISTVLAGEIIAATKRAGLPVSVKTRLGYSKVEEWRDWLSFLFSQDLACLTVHLRTKKEMSKVEAHYELIPEIVKLRDELAPQTLLMINGDIADRPQVLQERCLYEKYSGVDGFMIGRGIFANPFCFTNLQNPTRAQLFELLNFHLNQFDFYDNLAQEQGNLPQKFDPLKRFFKIYVKDFNGAKELREKMFNAKNTAEVREILTDYVRQIP